MSTAVKAAPASFLKLVDSLVTEALDEMPFERRGETRRPFCRQATILVSQGNPRIIMAFTRDVSDTGIGLLHAAPLEPGEITVNICRGNRGSIKLRVDVKWCHACGKGWCMSGGRILCVD